MNFSALSTHWLLSVSWKFPKSPNFKILPSTKYFANTLVRSLNTARTSGSETVESTVAISLANSWLENKATRSLGISANFSRGSCRFIFYQ